MLLLSKQNIKIFYKVGWFYGQDNTAIYAPDVLQHIEIKTLQFEG